MHRYQPEGYTDHKEPDKYKGPAKTNKNPVIDPKMEIYRISYNENKIVVLRQFKSYEKTYTHYSINKENNAITKMQVQTRYRNHNKESNKL